MASHPLQLTSCIPYAVLTPRVLLLTVWPLPRSLATTKGISVDVFSSPYLDVSVQAVPSVYIFRMCLLHMNVVHRAMLLLQSVLKGEGSGGLDRTS